MFNMFSNSGALSTQNQTASGISAGLGAPLSVTVINKMQDWQQRQVLQYAALKGHMVSDFLGLRDWQQQITMYSATNALILGAAYKAIKVFIDKNVIANSQCIPHPILGKVGRSILSFFGLETAFRVPQEILTKPSSLSGNLR